MLTFDDGHVSNYEHAWPILQEFGVNAVFFISTNLIGKSGYLDWDQIKELDANGFNIGSHGVNHIPLTNLPDAELAKELGESKKMLEDRLGKTVGSFSVPRGFYNARVRRAAESAGYRFICTSRFGLNSLHPDPLALARMAVKADTSEHEFTNWINGDLGLKGILENVKDFARGTFPPKWYETAASLRARRAKQSQSGFEIASATLGTLPRNDDEKITRRIK